MRLYSTPQSAEDGEVSLLAIVETILASGFSIYVAFRWNVVAHIAIGAAVAPLLMLRTPESTKLGFDLFERIGGRFAGSVDLIVALGLPFVGPFVRIAATILGVRRNPRTSLLAIPSNWRRQCFSVDSSHPPEIVPGSEVGQKRWALTRAREGLPGHSWREFLGEFRRSKGLLGVGLGVLAMIYVLGVLYSPALLYRWSFKATAIVWLPLVWVTTASLQKGLELKVWLKQIKEDDEIEKLRRKWSAFVLGVLGLKYLHITGWISAQPILDKIPDGKLETFYLIPEALPWWQIASGFNALLTFGLLFVASSALPRVSMTPPKWERGSKMSVEAASWMRGMLSWYSILAVIYIFGVESLGLTWPQLGTKFLPFL